MSYNHVKNDDSVYEYLTRLIDLNEAGKHLLAAGDEQTFIAWFEKMELIDRRSLAYYIKKHRAEIPEQYIRLVEHRLIKL